MSIFLDSSRMAVIEKFHRMGIIRGVTTNPTIMLKEGVTVLITSVFCFNFMKLF